MVVSLYGLLPTEQVNLHTQDIDLLPTDAMLRKINAEDALVPQAVEKIIPEIAVVVDKIADAFRQERHLFYFGAGTSGRLGVLDASECPPTFGVSPACVQAVIAGGDIALRTAVEGAEDSEEDGRKDFLRMDAQSGDVVVGISASGSPAYLYGIFHAARQSGCFTALVTCNAGSPFNTLVDQMIIADVGPEVITGSTRMKAGTAQKLILNMLTTGAMIQTGKTYENFMVDVQPTNRKLKDRARRIVATLAEVSERDAEEALELSGYQVKPAVVMLKYSLTLEEANERLRETGGKLRLVTSY